MNRKIISFFFAIIFLILISPSFNQKAFAAQNWQCSIKEFTPDPLTTENKTINKIVIDTANNALDTDQYFLVMNGPGQQHPNGNIPINHYAGGEIIVGDPGYDIFYEYTNPTNGVITFNIPFDRVGKTGRQPGEGYRAGEYKFNLIRKGSSELLCDTSGDRGRKMTRQVTTASQTGQNYCTIDVSPKTIYSNETDVQIKVNFTNQDMRGGDNEAHHVRIYDTTGALYREFFKENNKSTKALEAGTSIGKFPGGESANYRVEVMNRDCQGIPFCPLETMSCSQTFNSRNRESGGGSVGCTAGDSSVCQNNWYCLPNPNNPNTYSCQNPQEQGNSFYNNPYLNPHSFPKFESPCLDVKDKQCKVISFGIFNIPTDAPGLISKLLQIMLAISGIVALIFIIVSGYRFMLSQGNPEAVQEARESLTSAIVGLLFIIFALVILQLITVNILHIPGFKP